MASRQWFIGVKRGVIINCGSILFRSYTLFIIFSDVRLTPRSWLRQSGSSADKAVKHLRNTKTSRKAIILYSRFSRFFTFSPCTRLLCSAPSRRLSLSPRRR